MKWLIEAIEGGLKYWLMVGGRIREKVERGRRRIWYRNIRKTRSVKTISARFYTYEYQYQRVSTKIAKFLLRQLAVWCKGTCPFPIDEGHTRTWTKGRRRKYTLAGSGCIACTSASGAPCLGRYHLRLVRSSSRSGRSRTVSDMRLTMGPEKAM